MQSILLPLAIVGVTLLLPVRYSDRLTVPLSASMHAPAAGISSEGLVHQGPPAQVKQPSPNIEHLGLGTERTVVLVFAAECKECLSSVDFYKRLLDLPGMDGKRKRVVLLAVDGVIPVLKSLESKGFKPHRVTSYPRLEKPIELKDQAPALMVVDGGGMRLGVWTGLLDQSKQMEVISALGSDER